MQYSCKSSTFGQRIFKVIDVMSGHVIVLQGWVNLSGNIDFPQVLKVSEVVTG